MAYEGRRPHYTLSVEKKVRVMSEEGYRDMAVKRSAKSIDGLPALPQFQPAE